MRFRSVLFAAAVLLAGGSALHAQVSVDPNDEFYPLAQGWELRGLVSRPLPLLRPYPLNVVRDVLNDAIVNGDDAERAEAERQWNRVFGKKLEFYLDGAFDLRRSAQQEDEARGVGVDSKTTKNVRGEIGVRGDVVLHPLVGVGYGIGFYGESADFDDWNPYKTAKAQDSVFDAVSVSKLDVYNNWNTNVQFGNSSVYAAAGVNRVGFGPYLGEGLALNDMGYHSANLLFSATRGIWSYASVMEIIGASTNTDNTDLSSGKFLAFHVMQVRPFPWLRAAYYENIISGPSFNMAYLFPAPYMAVQNIGGANDNLQMGLLVEVLPTPGLNWATDIFVDDLEVEDVIKMHFDTKIRIGAQSGVVFTPSKSVLTRLAASYQCVLPYVYAHWEYESSSSGVIRGNTTNYQNYLNSGVGIGARLDPNSDKVSFSATFRPVERLTVGFSTAFIRHANSAEAFDGEDAAEYVLASAGRYRTDGTANMHQMLSDDTEGKTSGNHVSQAWDCLGFMTSDHKLYVCQAGLSARYDLPQAGWGRLSFTLGYTFEYVRNAGVDSNVYTGLGWEKAGDAYAFNGATYATKDEMYAAARDEAAKQKAGWVSALRDQVNHYISVGFKYAY